MKRYIPISLLLGSAPPPPIGSQNPKVRLERLTRSLTGSVARSTLYYLKQRREYSMNNSSFAEVTNKGLGLGLNKVKLSRFECYFSEVISPITFDDFRDPPPLPMPSFSKQIWVAPLWILPKFSAIHPFRFSVTTDPHFWSPKNQVTP